MMFKSSPVGAFVIDLRPQHRGVYSINWKSNVVSKKGWKWLNDARRLGLAAQGRGISTDALIINSIPKSGTHLLYQVVDPLARHDFGGFLATTPSVSLRRRTITEHLWLLRHLFNDELLSAHMFYEKAIEQHLIEQGIPMIFIIRDPRDILFSELNYLSNMNRWHRMHRYYKQADSFDDAFNLCLGGLPEAPFEYPKLVERIQPYLGWLNSPACLTVRFEDLNTEHSRQQELARIASYLVDSTLWKGSIERFIHEAAQAISPEKSHTFSGGGSGIWGDRLSRDQIDRMQEQLAPVISAMGYT